MKAAVSAVGKELTSEVDSRFGRAAWLLIVDTDKAELEAIENSEGTGAAGGAGTRTAQLVIDKGVEWVLTGHCGPNAFRALEGAGVKVVVGLEGSVYAAIKKLEAGQLTPAGSADVGARST